MTNRQLLQNKISTEFDNFFEFESTKKTHVLSVSCKLFAEHILDKLGQEHADLTAEVKSLKEIIRLMQNIIYSENAVKLFDDFQKVLNDNLLDLYETEARDKDK